MATHTAFALMTVEDIVKSFPTHEIEKIEGRPTYAILKPLIKGLNECAEVIPTSQPRGHLYLLKTDTEFLAITGEAKVIPIQPPNNPIIPTGSTQFVIQQAN